MKVEFLVVCRPGAVSEDSLRELLQQTLTNNLDEKPLDELADAVRFTHQRQIDQSNDEEANAARVIYAFDLNLPEETTYPQSVAKEFADALRDSEGIDHLLKFYDDLLLEQHIEHQQALFTLEMKLRKVLSFIYLNSYVDRHYELLRDETIKPMEKPSEAEMKEAFENEFFHLVFSSYINLNRRRTLNKVEDILRLVQEADDYDRLKQELSRSPIGDEADRDFVASLKQRLEPVEQLRNCVAHNRTPSERVAQNYSTARAQLEQALDEFLERFRPQ
jgi:hypothetical protein